MLDLVKLKLVAGDGGDGRVSFRREKYVPKGGPDGGTGGNGGNIIIRGSSQISTLQDFAGVKEYVASDGQDGGKRKMKGAKGDDLVLEVPVGTTVWLLAENEISHKRRQRYPLTYTLGRDEVEFELYDVEKEGQFIPERPADELEPVLTEEQVAESQEQMKEMSDEENEQLVQLKRQARLLKKVVSQAADTLSELDYRQLPKQQLVEITADGEEVIICQGGFGGRGNETFKGPANTTPMEAHYGTFGEKKIIVLEQKLLADVGLVGLPNAGKSTLISVLTQARPKIGNYPFTTLEPHLGVMPLLGAGKQGETDQPSERKEVVIADIPGLIAGASQGKGLGHTFLRHIEHCQVLAYVLFVPLDLLGKEQGLTGEDQKQVLDEQVQAVWQQYQELRSELHEYEPLLVEKPSVVCVNKIDLYSSQLQDELTHFFAGQGEEVVLCSAATREGLDQLRKRLLAKF